MNHGKTKKKNDPLKENTFAFPIILQTQCEILHLFFFGSNLVIFCGHIWSGCFQMSSKWLSVREEHCQSEKNIALKQLHFLKWILFPKVVTDHTVSPRGLHSACGPYVVQACSRVKKR